MANPAIISLAILKVNWDKNKKDYVENFVPIIAECIRRSNSEIVTIEEVKNNVNEYFGFNLPQNAIKTILSRVRKRGYIRKDQNTYQPVRKNLDKLNINEIREGILEKQERLFQNLISFCRDNYNIDWSLKKAEDAFLSFLDENLFDYIKSIKFESLTSAPQNPSKKEKYIIASFIKSLQDNTSVEFDYIETVVKGIMLANAIFLPEPNKANENFRNTAFYFDTSFLIYALGYAGETRERSCIELLELLYKTGADLICFSHTVDEIRGALDACAARINSGRLRDAYGPSIEYFVQKNSTSSDIYLYSSQIEKNLKKLHIEVKDKPVYIKEYVIGEKELEVYLKDQMQFYQPPEKQNALQRDVDSLSAIMRFRKGQSFYRIENCRAIFVTTNKTLIRTSYEFFNKDYLGSIGACISDQALTTLLWLKMPDDLPELPRKIIIADCYAFTQPSDRLWNAYLQEINKLEKDNRISKDDYFILRYDLQVKNAVMERTLGDENVITEDSIPEILEIRKMEIQEEIKGRYLDESIKRKKAEEKNEKIVSKISSLAFSFSKGTVILVKIIYFLVLFVGIFISLPWPIVDFTKQLDKSILAAILLLVLIVSSVNSLGGEFVKICFRKIEINLREWVEGRLFKILELF